MFYYGADEGKREFNFFTVFYVSNSLYINVFISFYCYCFLVFLNFRRQNGVRFSAA